MIEEKKLIDRLQIAVKQSDNSNFTNGLLSAIDIVNSQPKIGEWIPCSERLPDPPDRSVLVCDTAGCQYVAWYDGKCWRKGYSRFEDILEDDVVAWRLLPYPYTREE